MKKVLFVDDSAFQRTFMRSNLGDIKEINLTIVASANEALDEVKKDKFEWIISDYELPGTDSMEYLTELVRLTLGTKIIVLSGKLNSVIEEGLKSIGINKFIQKPFDPRKLIVQIKGE